MSIDAKFSDLKGKKLVKVEGKVGDDQMRFFTDTGEEYVMLHHQNCCEGVSIEDITGDLDDLIGAKILRAEGNSSGTNDPWPKGVPEPKSEYRPNDFTWTFYRIGTRKGTVVIRWYGISNGWYSTDVSFERMK